MQLEINTFINALGAMENSYHRQQIADCLASMPESMVRIRIDPGKRTLDQNAYLHAIFSSIANFFYEAGVRCPAGDKISAEAWKEYFKKKYGLTKVLPMPEGEPEVVIVSTAKYNRKQMTDFIEWIRHDDLILESGHYIMTPEEYKKGFKI